MPGMTRIEYKGTWRASLLYSAGDTVFHNTGGVNSMFYISQKEDNQGVVPGSASAFWVPLTGTIVQVLTEDHDAYEGTVEYHAGDLVTVGADVYVALQDSLNRPPAGNPTYWQLAFAGESLQWLVAPYIGPQQPGTEPNVLANNKARIWVDTGSNKTYLIFYSNGTYKYTEMTV